MNTYRIAIIGLGGMGGAHAEAVALEENCELVAGAEINPERAKVWSKRFGVKAIYDDYEKMLDEQQPRHRYCSNASTDASPANDRRSTARDPRLLRKADCPESDSSRRDGRNL